MKQQRKTPYRRIACNELITLEGQCLTHCVVELSEDGRVERHYALREELPFTEWMQGQLVLKKTGDGIVHVYYNDKKIN
jgi:hypothetical protein